MTNQEAIYQQKFLRKMHNASPEVMESCDIAIKALSVDYEGMVEEIEGKIARAELENKPGFATTTWDDFKISGMKTALEIVKKYVENKEE